MKKYLIASIALIIGIFLNAFTQEPTSTIGKKLQYYYWFVGTTYTGRYNTHPNEVVPSGCPDSGNLHCEDGYSNSDLNVPGYPFMGLNMVATIDDTIWRY